MAVFCSASVPWADFVYAQNSNFCHCRSQLSDQYPVSYSEGPIFGSRTRRLAILIHVFVVSSVFRGNCSVGMIPCNRTLQFPLCFCTQCTYSWEHNGQIFSVFLEIVSLFITTPSQRITYYATLIIYLIYAGKWIQ